MVLASESIEMNIEEERIGRFFAIASVVRSRESFRFNRSREEKTRQREQVEKTRTKREKGAGGGRFARERERRKCETR